MTTITISIVYHLLINNNFLYRFCGLKKTFSKEYWPSKREILKSKLFLVWADGLTVKATNIQDWLITQQVEETSSIAQ